MHLIKSRFVNKLLFIFNYFYFTVDEVKPRAHSLWVCYWWTFWSHMPLQHFKSQAVTMQQLTLLTQAVSLFSSPGHRATAEKDRPHGHTSTSTGYEDWPRKIPAGLLSQTTGWCARLRAHQQQVSPLHDTIMRRWPFSVGHVALQC